jgi:acetylornithine deacetylase/succinyl-diaminopimelate desuccinylase-like protein
MVTLIPRAADNPVEGLAHEKRVARALEWPAKNADWISDQQARITEIPAPEFDEKARGKFLGELLKDSGLAVHTDDAGNVIGVRAGADRRKIVLLVAHLDTVFPAQTNVKVRRGGARLEAPGISDNGAGLAALVAVARALTDPELRTGMTLVFSADVGEEGEGNLRGIRRLVEEYRDRLSAVIAIDGASTEHVTIEALASRRIEVTVTGPGGHSWSDFGAPNPVTGLARAIVRFSSIKVPSQPRSTFNFGMIEGGSSVNSIPYRAAAKVDLRSEEEAELAHMEADLRSAVQSGVEEEEAAARAGTGKLDVKFSVLGVRPGGKLAADAPLFAAIQNVDRYLGNRARFERSSTDANIPLSMGIPAIALGGGGRGGGAHSLSEWYDSTGRELGVKRILLTALAIAGVIP